MVLFICCWLYIRRWTVHPVGHSHVTVHPPLVLFTWNCSSRNSTVHPCRFSAPCGHHAGRHQGCCPPCSARGHHQGGCGRRGVDRRYPSSRSGRSPPPRGGVQCHRLGADGYSCPSARAIFVFIVIFPGRCLIARPHCLFDLQRHGRRRTSPSGGRNAQCSPAGEHRPRLHQLRQLA
jgi:hypothetical protein